MDSMFHASNFSDGAATPVKSGSKEERHAATPMGAPCTPGAPGTPHLQVVGSGGLLSAHATTPLTQPSCFGAAQKPIPMPLPTPEDASRQENAKAPPQFDTSKRSVAKKLDAWDATMQSPFKRRCLDKELDSAAQTSKGKLKMSKVPVVDFRSMVGLGMSKSEPGLGDSSDEEDEEEICTLRPAPQAPMGIPELMMKHGHQAAQREDSSGAIAATAATRRAAPEVLQGVQRHFVADFGALVESKGPLPRRTRLDELVEALDLQQPAYFEEDDALLDSSSDDEEDEPCVLRQPQAPVAGLGNMFMMLQQQA